MDDDGSGAGLAPSTIGSSADGPPPPLGGGGEGGREAPTVWSATLGRSLCRRVAEGESLSAICSEPGMPHRATVHRWTQEKPRFAEDLGRARTAGGRLARSRQLSTYDPVVAHEICERLCEGESLVDICRDPTLPAFGTVYRWRRAFPEFAEMLHEAREVQAERLCDIGWDIACKVTPESAHADRVRLWHLRWTAGVMAPRRYGKTSPVEAELPPQPVQHLLIRSFQFESRPDGALRVVGFTPNPDTGQPDRDHEGEWFHPKPAAPDMRVYPSKAAAMGLPDPHSPEERAKWL